MSRRWSYLTVEVKPTWTGLRADVIQAELSKQGLLGWELVNLVIGNGMRPAMLVFKREL
jgi:hypothetical protein